MKKSDGSEIFLEAIITGNSNGLIEKQEKEGQQELVNSQELPKECIGLDKDKYITKLKTYGIDVLNFDTDDIFIKVKFPNNIKLKGTDHSMWSELKCGEKIIASIFYKAAFYDRSSFIRFED